MIPTSTISGIKNSFTRQQGNDVDLLGSLISQDADNIHLSDEQINIVKERVNSKPKYASHTDVHKLFSLMKV